MKVLIMAGGSGERFWPLSTKEKPKQLLPLLSDKTMIRETVDRLNGLVTTEDIYIATNAIQVENLRKELPDIPEENIIIEPAFRDTAAAILYGSTYIASRNDSPVIIVLASDHAIMDIQGFQKALIKATDLASDSNKIVTLGIKPTYAETGYGYIKVDDNEILSVNNNVKFYEKPTLENAKRYIDDGHYLWNSGMFVFKYTSLVDQFNLYSPDHISTINSLSTLIANNFGHKLSELSKNAFLLFPKISIDFAIMEKSKDILCLPTDFGWSDVGSFDSLWNYHLSKGALKNKDDFKISYLNSSNNFIIVNSSLKINLIDINDLIIVENNGEILIMKRNSSQKIKDLIKIKK